MFSASSRVLVALTCAVLCLCAADGTMRRSADGVAIRRASLYAVKADELAAAGDVDVLITGDSRIFHGISPAEVSRVVALERGRGLHVYNAALPGAPPMAQFAMVLRALDAARPPSLVLISLSPYMFSSRIARNLARESLQTVWRVGDIPAAISAGASPDDVAEILMANMSFALRYRPQWLDRWLRHAGLPAPCNTGEQGFVALGGVEPHVQAERARQRARGYRTEMIRPDAQFGNEHQGYLEAMLRLLRARNVPVVLLGTPAASAMTSTEGADSIYPEHLAYVTRIASEYGTRFVDLEHTAPLVDSDFSDGDHLAVQGARRLSAFVARSVVGPLFGADAQARADCHTMFDFETSLEGFRSEGFGQLAVRRNAAPPSSQPVYGQRGRYFVSTLGERDADAATGRLVSPPFVLDGPTLRMRVGGGRAPGARVELWVGDEPVLSCDGGADEALRARAFDVAKYRGKKAELRVVDEAAGPWAHINVDDIAICTGGVSAR